MPNRILREGILTSPRMAKLGWAEEVFYRRLMSVVDDFGRYYADPGLLHAACYPRQLNKVSDSDIGKWLRACVDAALVRVYPAQDGESYLQLLDFGQQVRAKKSRFPGPLSSCVADAEHLPTNAHLDVSVSEDVSVEPNGSVARGDAASIPACPYEDIVSLFHEVLPELPRVRLMGDERKRSLQTFWRWVLTSKKSGGDRRAQTADQALTWIRDYFALARENDFLMGRGGRGKGHENWQCDIDFLVSKKGLKQVIEKTRVTT